MLYTIDDFYTFLSSLSDNERNILKNYDIFQFFEIDLRKSDINEFEKLLSKYLILIKLKGYNIEYVSYSKYSCGVLFNGEDIDILYKNNILSLNDIINIKNIINKNFVFATSEFSRFYFKSYEDAKEFLQEISVGYENTRYNYYHIVKF